jgi:hypothetical protein
MGDMGLRPSRSLANLTQDDLAGERGNETFSMNLKPCSTAFETSDAVCSFFHAVPYMRKGLLDFSIDGADSCVMPIMEFPSPMTAEEDWLSSPLPLSADFSSDEDAISQPMPITKDTTATTVIMGLRFFLGVGFTLTMVVFVILCSFFLMYLVLSSEAAFS